MWKPISIQLKLTEAATYSQSLVCDLVCPWVDKVFTVFYHARKYLIVMFVRLGYSLRVLKFYSNSPELRYSLLFWGISSEVELWNCAYCGISWFSCFYSPSRRIAAIVVVRLYCLQDLHQLFCCQSLLSIRFASIVLLSGFTVYKSYWWKSSSSILRVDHWNWSNIYALASKIVSAGYQI